MVKHQPGFSLGRLWDDPKYKSNDSYHRVWVNDVGTRVAMRQAQGYRLVMEGGGKHVEMIVGANVDGSPLYGVCMEIPQIDYQMMVSPKPPGMLPGEVLWSMARGGRVADPPDDWDGDDNDRIHAWKWRRILCFPAQGEPFRGLINFTRGNRWIRLAIRYHNDRYYYVRLRWRPWKFTAERRTRFTEEARIDAKYPEMAGGDDP